MHIGLRLFGVVGILTFNALGWPGAAVALTIGSLQAPTQQALPAVISSLYVNMAASGPIPITYVVAKDTDTVELLLKQRSSFAGAYFPVALDSITCDLNPGVCHRPLAITAPTSNPNDITLTNPTQVEFSKGEWTIQPGTVLALPDFRVTTKVVPKEVIKQAGTSIDDILGAEEDCAADSGIPEGCKSYLDLFNSGNHSYQDVSYSGPIVIPQLDYMVTVPSSCDNACALPNKSFRVDLRESEYLTAPYVLMDPPWLRWLKNTSVTAQIVPAPTFVPNPSIPLPSAVSTQVQSAGKLVTKAWVPSQVNRAVMNRLIPFSASADESPIPADAPFATDQTSAFRTMNYPFGELAQIRSGIGSKAMIIDSQFDPFNCKFASAPLKIFDCRNSDNSYPDECPLDTSHFKFGGPSNPAPSGAVDMPEDCTNGHADVVTTEATTQAVTAVHGTHLAGIIGASWDGLGVAGMSPNSTIIGIEINEDEVDGGNGRYGDWLYKVIFDIAKKNDVHVVNLSFGYRRTNDSIAGSGAQPTDWLTQLITDQKTWLLFVAAAGNTIDPQGDCATFPACLAVGHLDNVVTVVGMSANGKNVMSYKEDGRITTGNVNPDFTVGAVADSVLSTIPLNRFSRLSGSSQAAAFVTGTVALADSLGVNMSPAVARNRLVVCSNIEDPDLLDAMRGGILDIGCFIDSQSDRVVMRRDQSIADAQINAVQVGNSPPGPTIDFETSNGIQMQVQWSQIAGFQRIADADDDLVLYVDEKPGWPDTDIQRFRGEFATTVTLKGMRANHPVALHLEDIEKYVRHAS